MGVMRQMTRYVLREFGSVFLVTLFGFTLLVIMAVLIVEAIRQGLGPEPVMRMIPYALPTALRPAIPVAMLFAACSVFGRMSALNEFVAVKSLGISPMALIWPTLILAFLVSLLSVGINDVAATWGREGAQRVVLQSLEQIVYGTLRTHRSYRTSNGRVSMSVRRVDDRELIQPTMSFQSADGQRTVTLTAEKAELRGDPELDKLAIHMWNTVVEFGDRTSAYYPDELRYEIPLRDAVRNSSSVKHPTEYASRDIPDEIMNQLSTISRREQSLAALAACQLLTGDFAALKTSRWSNSYQDLKSHQMRLHRLYTEPWRRWSEAFSCFFFVWVGAPLAIRLRNADVSTTFLVAFGPILVLYYPLLAIVLGQAKVGAIPPVSVWLSNVCAAIAGVLLFRHVRRY